jgi:hypothetical protein
MRHFGHCESGAVPHLEMADLFDQELLKFCDDTPVYEERRHR